MTLLSSTSLVVAALAQLPAPAPTPHIPLVLGLTVVSVVHFADGDRENALMVADLSPEGVLYGWRLRQRGPNGQPLEASLARFVRENDMASAPGMNGVLQVGVGREIDEREYRLHNDSRTTV